MQNGKWRMENGEALAKFAIVCLKWELFPLFPFFIFHFPFLALGDFVSLWPNYLLLPPAEHLFQARDIHAAGELSQISAGGLLGFSRRDADG